MNKKIETSFLKLFFGIICCFIVINCSWAAGVPKYNPNDPNPRPGLYRVGDMHCARNFHVSTLLKDGRVLITGGRSKNVGDSTRNTAEIFNLKTGEFKKVKMLYEHFGSNHKAILLEDGNVLISGGFSTEFQRKPIYEIFNAKEDKFYKGPISNLYLDHSYSGYYKLYNAENNTVLSYGSAQKTAFGINGEYKTYISAMEVYNGNDNSISSFESKDSINYKPEPIAKDYRTQFRLISNKFGHPRWEIPLQDNLFFIVLLKELEYNVSTKTLGDQYIAKNSWFTPLYIYNTEKDQTIKLNEYLRSYTPNIILLGNKKLLITGGLVPAYVKDPNDDPKNIPYKNRINLEIALKATKHAYIYIYE